MVCAVCGLRVVRVAYVCVLCEVCVLYVVWCVGRVVCYVLYDVCSVWFSWLCCLLVVAVWSLPVVLWVARLLLRVSCWCCALCVVARCSELYRVVVCRVVVPVVRRIVVCWSAP